MIELEQVSRSFGDIVAVRDVSFRLRQAEVLGFLGPNGAGKSTTMRMIAGVLAPDSGRISIGGVAVEARPLYARTQLGFLPEGAPAWGDLSVRQFLRFCALARKLTGKEGETAILRAVELTGLSAVLAQKIDTLSKGYQRRVGLAQAILHRPPALIMDEPTDGLDPNQKQDIRNTIADMAHSTAIIISTHILEEVEAVCTRAMIIDKGQVLCDEPPARLRNRSRYKGAVRLTLPSKEAGAAVPILLRLDAVGNVEEQAQGTDMCLTIFPHDNSQVILTPIQEEVKKNGWSVQALALDSGRLDDVFRALTKAEKL